MFAKSIENLSCLCTVALLLVISMWTIGCTSSPTPTSLPSPAPSPLPSLTPSPAPTLTLQPPPTVTLNVSPGPQVPVGQGVAIVLNVDPYQQLDWTWDVSGTSGGQLNTKTGENVVYTAGKEGVDIIVARAKTPSGDIVKQTVSISVIAAFSNSVPTTSAPLTQVPPATAPPSINMVTLTTPQSGQTVPCSNVASGTYPLDLEDAIWPVVYVGGRYHPQDEGGKGAQKISGNWYQTVRFGDCSQTTKDIGQPFQLIIVTANASANTEFEKYIAIAQKSGIYTGLIELPDGVKEQTRIVVNR